jgi:hypothetical protein
MAKGWEAFQQATAFMIILAFTCFGAYVGISYLMPIKYGYAIRNFVSTSHVFASGRPQLWEWPNAKRGGYFLVRLRSRRVPP